MDIKAIISKLHPLERKVISSLKDNITNRELESKTSLSGVEVMRALQWLENKKLITTFDKVEELISLDLNGVKYKEMGLPEYRFLRAIKDSLKSKSEIIKEASLEEDEFNVCIGILRKKAAIEINKDKELLFKITPQGQKLLEKPMLEMLFLEQNFPIDKSKLTDEMRFAFDNLKKRHKIIKVDIVKTRIIKLTELGRAVIKNTPAEVKVIDKITPVMLKEGSWKNKEFRAYDVEINVPRITGGKRHFVNQAIEYIRQIWLEMGFKEMEGPIIQTSFWNLDVLFVPQDHPARSMQDTFFIDNPSQGTLPDNALAEAVKAVHENGGTTGSKGWQYRWSREVASQNMLRTHTTCLSARTIATLKKSDLPAKFFSVNKVFRNETLDWKHLFEFNQVEGIVVDYNVNLQHLFGYLKEFYRKMGYKDVRLVPSHFPYTEPSMEILALHPLKNEWVELGGSGMFRPEVTIPLFGEEVRVLAWGQGMERIITEYYGITDLRELYKNDIEQLRSIKSWIKL